MARRLTAAALALALCACSAGGGRTQRDGPLFADDFSDPRSGWATGRQGEGLLGYAGGRFSVTVARAGAGAPVLSTGIPAIDDVADVSVRATVVGQAGVREGHRAAGGGVVCRAADADHYYYGQVGADGYFSMGRNDDGAFLRMLGGQANPAIQRGSGAVNEVRLDCVRDTITMFVNGRLVGQANDGRFRHGAVGMLVFNNDGGPRARPAEVAFDDLVVERESVPPAAPIAAPPRGTIRFQDGFDDPTTGWLGGRATTGPGPTVAAFEDGTLAIRVQGPSRGLTVDSRGVFDRDGAELVDLSDVAVETEVTLGGSLGAVAVFCRGTGSPEGSLAGYALYLRGDSSYSLLRTGRPVVELAGGRGSRDVAPPEEGNRIRIDCRGGSVTGTINGIPLLQAEDAAYHAGLIGMVAEASADQVGAARATLARFLDVTVRDV